MDGFAIKSKYYHVLCYLALYNSYHEFTRCYFSEYVLFFIFLHIDCFYMWFIKQNKIKLHVHIVLPNCQAPFATALL